MIVKFALCSKEDPGISATSELWRKKKPEKRIQRIHLRIEESSPKK